MILDFKLIARHLGWLMLAFSGFIAAMALFALIDESFYQSQVSYSDVWAFLITSGTGCVLSFVLIVVGRSQTQLLGQREALLLVALSWILGAGFAAIPFYLWALLRADASSTPNTFDSYVSCYFEAMSGLTTTGATVVEKLAVLPRSLLLWRAVTHWLGGGGIVVLFVAVLPLLGVGGRRVFQREATGPTKEAVTPRIQDTARLLWTIYCTLTLAEIFILVFCGMGWFDATCHSFATLSTGGFGTKDASIAAYDSSIIHVVIIIFMILGGGNFGLYHELLRGKWREVVTDPELRVYLAILFIASVLVVVSLLRHPGNVSPSTGQGPEPVGIVVRDAVFQVVSINTTTGFCTADFDRWSYGAKVVLFLLMFVNGSAGSTCGGVKVIRILMLAKILRAEIEHAYRPNVVRTVRVGRTVISSELKAATLIFLVGYALTFATGAVFLRLLEDGNGGDTVTAVTASATVLGNIGPGLSKVGATQNYAWFTAPSKLVMSALMLVGRLELFTIIVLFTPRFWRRE